MGDQVGASIEGMLQFVPAKELNRVRTLPASKLARAQLFATLCRINVLYMIARAGSGHIGSSFSSMDIMAWLHLNELNLSAGGSGIPTGHEDVFFSSKGHDAPALYCTLAGIGRLDFNLIHQLRRLDGLPGHPDISTPSVATNTGSLGMGVSKAKGMIFANRLRRNEGRVFVLTGDGELQEGQFWESLISAANHKLGELTVIIDHNKMQSDTLVAKVSDLGDLGSKLLSFGWHVSRCDGHDMGQMAKLLAGLAAVKDQPKAIIADTVKGKGVSFMEHTSIDSDVESYKFHSGAPSEEMYARALRELVESASRQVQALSIGPIVLESVVNPKSGAASNPTRLIPSYSAALLDQARRNPSIVALDADLITDTGLVAFKAEFPDRFIECGIAEQDMVSQAGGMALRGLLPVVHSFACFLSSRPNEQIYNNSTERKKIVYVGSLAGLIPGGPGHSHQAVRDISALSAVPGMTIVEPSLEDEVGPLLDWCLNSAPSSCYMRLVSAPTSFPAFKPEPFRLREGFGRILMDGRDGALVAYGPTLVAEALKAAARASESGLSVAVISFPWLNRVSVEWLREVAASFRSVVILDNHYTIGGLFERMAATAALGAVSNLRLHSLGIDRIPACGTSEEVLRAHNLDADAILGMIESCVLRDTGAGE